ncbi:collagen alpha-1(I) chain-like [Erinaceus europaeus]|uniref:Collagen alpha-1(I) chain-like n=1 Tax=Erinaceus europaeus TaxID=9365 RepID=A0ABM3WNR8_ERIEU|nr:collagen alpha-1(I) chain-like [Erinaceus europaeus]
MPPPPPPPPGTGLPGVPLSAAPCPPRVPEAPDGTRESSGGSPMGAPPRAPGRVCRGSWVSGRVSGIPAGVKGLRGCRGRRAGSRGSPRPPGGVSGFAEGSGRVAGGCERSGALGHRPGLRGRWLPAGPAIPSGPGSRAGRAGRVGSGVRGTARKRPRPAGAPERAAGPRPQRPAARGAGAREAGGAARGPRPCKTPRASWPPPPPLPHGRAPRVACRFRAAHAAAILFTALRRRAPRRTARRGPAPRRQRARPLVPERPASPRAAVSHWLVLRVLRGDWPALGPAPGPLLLAWTDVHLGQGGGAARVRLREALGAGGGDSQAAAARGRKVAKCVRVRLGRSWVRSCALAAAGVRPLGGRRQRPAEWTQTPGPRQPGAPPALPPWVTRGPGSLGGEAEGGWRAGPRKPVGRVGRRWWSHSAQGPARAQGPGSELDAEPGAPAEDRVILERTLQPAYQGEVEGGRDVPPPRALAPPDLPPSLETPRWRVHPSQIGGPARGLPALGTSRLNRSPSCQLRPCARRKSVAGGRPAARGPRPPPAAAANRTIAPGDPAPGPRPHRVTGSARGPQDGGRDPEVSAAAADRGDAETPRGSAPAGPGSEVSAPAGAPAPASRVARGARSRSPGVPGGVGPSSGDSPPPPPVAVSLDPRPPTSDPRPRLLPELGPCRPLRPRLLVNLDPPWRGTRARSPAPGPLTRGDPLFWAPPVLGAGRGPRFGGPGGVPGRAGAAERALRPPTPDPGPPIPPPRRPGPTLRTEGITLILSTLILSTLTLSTLTLSTLTSPLILSTLILSTLTLSTLTLSTLTCYTLTLSTLTLSTLTLSTLTLSTLTLSTLILSILTPQHPDPEHPDPSHLTLSTLTFSTLILSTLTLSTLTHHTLILSTLILSTLTLSTLTFSTLILSTLTLSTLTHQHADPQHPDPEHPDPSAP